MIARQPARHDLVRRPHPSPRIVAVKRPDQLTQARATMPMRSSSASSSRLGLAQVNRRRSGMETLSSRAAAGDVAKVLRQRALDQGKIEIGAGGRNLRKMHR